MALQSFQPQHGRPLVSRQAFEGRGRIVEREDIGVTEVVGRDLAGVDACGVVVRVISRGQRRLLSVQAGVDIGQRGSNGQPGGRLTTDGGLPSRVASAFLSVASSRGTAPSKPMVYGILGR